MADCELSIQCPLCNSYFDTSTIEVHAAGCSGKDAGAWDFLKRPGGNVSTPVTRKKPKINQSSQRNSASNKKTFLQGSNTLSIPQPQALLSPGASVDLIDETKAEATSSKNAVDADGLNILDQSNFIEKLRANTLDAFVGQEQVLEGTNALSTLLKHNKIPSMILWGPSGCGKTTLASIIEHQCKSTSNVYFRKVSAIPELKSLSEMLKNDAAFRGKGRKCIVFVDEIHRLNKLQQDHFLSLIDDGLMTLLGCTTENPSFSLNNALISRCRVVPFTKLSPAAIRTILKQALIKLGVTVTNPSQNDKQVPAASSTDDVDKENVLQIEDSAVGLLSETCDGDARVALNNLKLVLQAARLGSGIGACSDVRSVCQRTHLLYDKHGDEHFNCISALHKSVRGSDASAALYWLARMLEGGEDPKYIARRLIRVASEDIGLADSFALVQAVNCFHACHFIGMPECDVCLGLTNSRPQMGRPFCQKPDFSVILAQTVTYLARAHKSVEVYEAYGRAKDFVRNCKQLLHDVPAHLKNAPTKLMKDLGFGKDYKYNPHYVEPVDQLYVPPEMSDIDFFNKS